MLTATDAARSDETALDAAAAAPLHTPRAASIAWIADDAALERLCWRNAGLNLVTLGLYSFWAKTELRRGIWRAVHIDGQPLHYTGTARELLRPVVIIGVGVIGMLGALLLAKWLFVLPKPKLTPSPWRFLITIPLIYVMGLGVWRARAYLLSRTMMGDEPGALVGNRFSYAAAHLATALLMPLTLGFALPYRQIWLHRRLVGGMKLAGHSFEMIGSPVALLKRFALVWAGGLTVYLSAVLALAVTPTGRKIALAVKGGVMPIEARDVLTVGVIGIAAIVAIAILAAWYRAGALRHMASATRIGGRALHLDLSTRAYVRLAAANTLMKIGSLMFLSPLAELRHTRFLLSRVTLH